MNIKLNLITFFNILVLLTSCNGQTTERKIKTENILEGDKVTELGKSIMVIHQDKKNDYWFGSWETGVYKYDGKELVNYTTKHGLLNNRIDEIKEEQEELRGKLEHLRGWEAKKCEEKYEATERSLLNIPEDDEIELLQEQMEEAPRLFENEMLGVKDGEGFEQKRSRQKLTSKQKKFAKTIRP